MKVKFNKFERVAGLFVLGAIVGAFAFGVGVALKKGWFTPKVMYYTHFEDAEGIHAGTEVQMSGLRVGSVDTVELKANNDVIVHFMVSESFTHKIREGSIVRMVRPFVIGEKVLDITAGEQSEPAIEPEGMVVSQATTDVMDLLSGKKLGPVLDSFEGVARNLQTLINAFADPERTEILIQIFDQMHPFIHSMQKMSKEMVKMSQQMTRRNRLQKVMARLSVSSYEINRFLIKLNRDSPELPADLGRMSKNVAGLTKEFERLVPTLRAIAPDLPDASQHAIVALEEIVVTLKALQKTFILSGNAEEAREELAEKMKKIKRETASEKSQPVKKEKEE